MSSISSNKAPEPVGHYPHARRVGDLIFLSGVGMPTVAVLDLLERDLGKPVISAAGAMMWNALRIAGVAPAMPGYGRLFAARQETVK